MTRTKKWLIGGVALAAVAGMAAAADAQAVHELTVQLPGGGVEHVHYTGNVKPVVVMLPGAFPAGFMQSAFAPFPAFADFNLISAQMDHQMHAMLLQARAMQSAAQSGQFNASFGNMPAGSVSYTQVSTWSGNGVCTRTVRTSEPAGGGKLQTVSNVSGNCAGASSPEAPAAKPSSDIIQAKAVGTVHRAQPSKT